MRLQSGFVQLWGEQFSQHGSRPLPITFKRRTNLFNTHGEKAAGLSTPYGAIKGRRAVRTTKQPTPRLYTWNSVVLLVIFFTGFVWTLTFGKVICLLFRREDTITIIGKSPPVFRFIKNSLASIYYKSSNNRTLVCLSAML